MRGDAQTRRPGRWLIAIIALAVTATAAVGAVGASAAGNTATVPPNAPAQEKQLFASCQDTLASMRAAVKAAAGNPAQTIQSHLQVSTPGTLNGKLGFNRSGKVITLVGDHAPAPAVAARTTYNCGAAATNTPGLGPGANRVVATVQRTFTKPGLYTVSFKLNATGRQILAQVAKADRGYRRHNPHGKRPPTIAVGVSLAYVTSG